MGDENKLCCPVIIFRSNVIPLRTGLITHNCWLYSCFSLLFSPLLSSLNGFMGYGLSNVVAKCHFLFYWDDSSVCAVVEVRSTFMKFALWLISRSGQVSFSLSLSSRGGQNKLSINLPGPCWSLTSLILKWCPVNQPVTSPRTPYLCALLYSGSSGITNLPVWSLLKPLDFGLQRALSKEGSSFFAQATWVAFCLWQIFSPALDLPLLGCTECCWSQLPDQSQV